MSVGLILMPCRGARGASEDGVNTPTASDDLTGKTPEEWRGKRPNILVILADDLGFSDLGCYGGEIATPNLDGLASNGLRWTQFYSTARCWPSRAVLLTGYYAQQVRRDAQYGSEGRGGQGQRPEWAPLLSDLLRPLGYRSYHSGKWHVDGQPLRQGFDRAYVIEDHDRYFYPKRHTQDGKALDPVPEGTDFYLTDHIAQFAIDCLQEHATEHPDKPFFQFLAFTAPHFPLQAPEADVARYQDRYLHGWDVLRTLRYNRLRHLGFTAHPLPPLEPNLGPPYHFPDRLESLGSGEVFRPLPWTELNADQKRFQATKMAIHAAMVDRMDRELGRVFEQLRKMDAWENTLILFASDNGATAEIMVRGDGHDATALPGSGATFLCLGPGFSSASNTPLRRHKTWVHEGGIASPLIVSWPQAGLEAGALRTAPTHFIDLVPTFLELAGTEPVTAHQASNGPARPGRSLLPLLRQDAPSWHEHLWWCHDDHRALRSGDWKLVAARGEPWELYNLKVDRGEMNNLAAEHPDRVRQLQEVWTGLSDTFIRQATP